MFKLFVPLAGIIGSMFIIGAESSSELNNPEKLTEEHAVEKENTRSAQFQAQLIAMEEERLLADYVKEQEKIIARKQKERLAAEQKLIEEERLAEEARLATEQNTQTNQVAVVTNSSEQTQPATAKEVQSATQTGANKSTQTSSAPASTPQAPTSQSTRTDGFNFNGHHFALGSFTGGGSVPQETNYVYQWTDKPDHFLIERISPAGRVITGVEIGTKVVINGTTYTVTNMERNIPNDEAAVDYLYKHNASITFQTCETTKGANGRSHVRFWYAR